MNLILFCSGGFSTSLLVKKIEEAAKEKNIEISVKAYGVEFVDRLQTLPDVVLIGPQVRFRFKEISDKLSPIPVGVIDMSAYGLADGKAVLEQALEILK